MVNQELVKFVKEARNRGFDDIQIKEVLLKNRWPLDDIELAFAKTKPPLKFKNKVCIYLDSEVLKQIEKRANKNMLTVTEQIEDILRRSAINSKKLKSQSEKLDDMFISLFSRKK
ncbi:MAG TPA: hypothetical protein P5277_02245 [Candidatus Paceibacterota bacterium]|nr:hypothetical protein [Candidatus Paceibacterota bacterium]